MEPEFLRRLQCRLANFQNAVFALERRLARVNRDGAEISWRDLCRQRALEDLTGRLIPGTLAEIERLNGRVNNGLSPKKPASDRHRRPYFVY